MKKGQAGFELLTTYGWIVLLIVVIAGTIAYLGLVNPSEFLGETCEAGGDFSCVDYALFDDGTQSRTVIALRNLNEEPLRSTSKIYCEYENGLVQDNFTIGIKSGEIIELECIGPSQGWNSGQKRKVNFKIVYYTNITTPGIPRATNGFLFAKVK